MNVTTLSSVRQLALLMSVAYLPLLLGCGDGDGFELVPVSGTITMDGQPLDDVFVIFRPELGRSSFATTDANGNYTLQYTTEKSGALPGKHKVSISSEREPDSDSDDPEKQKGSKERVPRIYNTQSTLEVEVAPRSREPINFDLKSS